MELVALYNKICKSVISIHDTHILCDAHCSFMGGLWYSTAKATILPIEKQIQTLVYIISSHWTSTVLAT